MMMSKRSNESANGGERITPSPKVGTGCLVRNEPTHVCPKSSRHRFAVTIFLQNIVRLPASGILAQLGCIHDEPAQQRLGLVLVIWVAARSLLRAVHTFMQSTHVMAPTSALGLGCASMPAKPLSNSSAPCSVSLRCVSLSPPPGLGAT